MKFTDGYWLVKDGYQINSLIEIVDKKIESQKITLFVAPKKITNRGDTLDGGLVTVEISAPHKDTFKVTLEHFKGIYDNISKFEVNEENINIDYEENDNEIIIINGKAKVIFSKTEWLVKYFLDDIYITGNSWRSTAYIKGTSQNYMREQFDISTNEHIYGLGERFTPFVKNGQTVDIWNEDGGTATEQAYKNIPFYISNKNYGLFINHSEKVSYEIASEVVSRISISVPSEKLEYYVILGKNMSEISSKYSNLTGKPALPPLWSFGLWLSTSFTTNYDENTVNHFIDKMEEYKIPLSVFHYDCFWMKEFEWMNFSFDNRVFPNPKEMIEKLKNKGLKICCWINPYIAQKSPLFKVAMDNGFLIKKLDGNVWQWDKWQAGMGIVDFTKKKKKKWYQDKLREMLEIGIDSFKTDFGERIPVDVKYFDNSDPMKMHNYYTQLYNETVFEVLQEKKGKDALVFARSATVGGQKFPVHWGGDCSSNYPSMAESLRGGLSLTMSGFGFWSHDISGFENTATPDVYKRWSQFGLLSTHSRLHGNTSYRVPWNFDEEAVEVVRFFSELKCTLIPYLFNSAINTSKTGIPSMSSMVFNFQDDLNCHYLDLQYILGDSILVAPIFNEDSIGEYYLPKGKWTHLITNESKEGGLWYKEKYDYFSLPVFVKENTIMPIGKINNKTVYNFEKNIEFNFYFVNNANYTLYGENEQLLGEIEGKFENNELVIKHNFPYQIKVKIINENGITEKLV